MQIIDLDSEQSAGQPLIKQFNKTYTSPNITISNQGTSDLYIIDITCDQKDLIKDKSSEKNVLIVTEAGNSVNTSYNDLRQQLPKKILPGNNIVIQLKITASESVSLPAKLFVETNEDGGRKRVFLLKGNLPNEPKIKVNPVHINSVRFPMTLIDDDKWNVISDIDGDGIGESNESIIMTSFESDIISASSIVSGSEYEIYFKGNVSDSTWTSLGASSNPSQGEIFTAISNGPGSSNTGEVKLNISSDNYLEPGDYITVIDTNNYNGVHKVIYSSPQDCMIKTQLLNGFFRGREEGVGRWAKITNTNYYGRDSETYGDIKLFSPAQFIAAINARIDQNISNSLKVALRKFKSQYAITTVSDLIATNPSIPTTYFGDPYYKTDGYTVAVIRTLNSGYTFSNIMTKLGKDKTSYNVPGIHNKDFILIDNATMSSQNLTDSTEEGSTIPNVYSFNGIHEIVQVFGCWKNDNNLYEAITGTTTANDFAIIVIKISGLSWKIIDSDNYDLPFGISNATFKTVSQSEDLVVQNMGSGSLIVNDVKDIGFENGVKIFDFPNIGFINSTTNEVMTIPKEGIVGNQFRNVNGSSVLHEFNLSKIEKDKTYTVTSLGDTSGLIWTTLGASTGNAYPSLGHTFKAKIDGTSSMGTAEVGRGIIIGSKDQEKFKLLFNKNNFGSNFLNSQLAIECNSPQDYDSDDNLIYKNHLVDVSVDVLFPQIHVRDIKKDYFKDEYELTEVIKFDNIKGTGSSQISFLLTNVGESDLYISDIELNNGTQIDGGVSIPIDPLQNDCYYTNDEGYTTFKPFWLLNKYDDVQNKDNQLYYTHKVITVDIHPTFNRSQTSTMSNVLKIYCNSNPNVNNAYRPKENLGYISINFEVSLSLINQPKRRSNIVFPVINQTTSLFNPKKPDNGGVTIEGSPNNGRTGSYSSYMNGQIEANSVYSNSGVNIEVKKHGSNEGDIEIYSHDSSNNKIVFTKQSDGVTYIGTFYNYNIDTEAKNSGDLNNGYDLIIKTTYPNSKVNYQEISGLIKIFSDPVAGKDLLIDKMLGKKAQPQFKVFPEDYYGYKTPTDAETLFIFCNTSIYFSDDVVDNSGNFRTDVWEWKIEKFNNSTSAWETATAGSSSDYVLQNSTSLTTKNLIVKFKSSGPKRISLSITLNKNDSNELTIGPYTDVVYIEEDSNIENETSLANIGTTIFPEIIDFGSLSESTYYEKNISIFNFNTVDKNYKAIVENTNRYSKNLPEKRSTIYLDELEENEEVSFTLKASNSAVNIGVGGFTYPDAQTIAGASRNTLKISSNGHSINVNDIVTIFDDSGYGLLNGEYICVYKETNFFNVQPSSNTTILTKSNVVISSAFNVDAIIKGKGYIINSLGGSEMSTSDWNNLGASGTPSVGQSFTASTNGITGKDAKVEKYLGGFYIKGKVDFKSLKVNLNTSDFKNRIDFKGVNRPSIKIIELGDSNNITSYSKYYSNREVEKVLITTTSDHNLKNGDILSIENVSSEIYRGDWKVDEIITTKKFIIQCFVDVDLYDNNSNPKLGYIRKHNDLSININGQYKLDHNALHSDHKLNELKEKINYYDQEVYSIKENYSRAKTLGDLIDKSRKYNLERK